jgi:hypothetical protein
MSAVLIRTTRTHRPSMPTRSSTALGPSPYTPQYTKFNSSPAPTYDALAPDPHGYASAIGTASARRRVASTDDAQLDPWGDHTPRASTSASASNGRTGLRARSKSHSKLAQANGGQAHPLQASAGLNAADTRPGLQRMLSSQDSRGGIWGLSDGWVEEPGDEGAGTSEGAPTPGSREMLVHKVCMVCLAWSG